MVANKVELLEADGSILQLVHGTPSWSAGFRCELVSPVDPSAGQLAAQ